MDRWKEKVVDTWGADLDPDLKTACDVEFSLAYGGKLLLHNTRLFLKCGRRYGICGKNGVGKTTLMRNVDNGKIEGLDPDLCSVFVESHADEDPDDSKPVQCGAENKPGSRRWRRRGRESLRVSRDDTVAVFTRPHRRSAVFMIT